jgi:hypothetical protein
MGLFDKKFCDFCGEKIGLLGNRKLADGNMCKECAKNISPHLTGRKQFTVADMKEHLAYREENKGKVAGFNPTSTYGGNTKLYIDENNGLWLVSGSRNYKNENPDVMTTTQVTGCQLEIKESRNEIKREGTDGNQISYNPPRYDIDYDFYITIHVNSPWFSEIEFKVNESRVEERHSAQYQNAERQANELKDALTQVHSEVRSQVTEAAKPKTSVVCPGCQATTIPDANGRCEFCGGAVAG